MVGVTLLDHVGRASHFGHDVRRCDRIPQKNSETTPTTGTGVSRPVCICIVICMHSCTVLTSVAKHENNEVLLTDLKTSLTMTEKEGLEKLLIFQQDLQSEEEALRKIIAKLNEQSHALQVEQLHILNAINKHASTKKPNEITNGTQVSLKQELVDPESQKLDLSITRYQSSEEDEDEMDDY